MYLSFFNRTRSVNEYGRGFIPSVLRTARGPTNASTDLTAISARSMAPAWYREDDPENPIPNSSGKSKSKGKGKKSSNTNQRDSTTADDAGIGVHVTVSEALPVSTDNQATTPTTVSTTISPDVVVASASDPTFSTIPYPNSMEALISGGSVDLNFSNYMQPSPLNPSPRLLNQLSSLQFLQPNLQHQQQLQQTQPQNSQQQMQTHQNAQQYLYAQSQLQPAQSNIVWSGAGLPSVSQAGGQLQGNVSQLGGTVDNLSQMGVKSGGMSQMGVNSGGLSQMGVNSGGLSQMGVNSGGLSQMGVNSGGLSQIGVNSAGLSQMGVNSAGLSQMGVNSGGLSQMGVNSAGLSQMGVNVGNLHHVVGNIGNLSQIGGISQVGGNIGNLHHVASGRPSVCMPPPTVTTNTSPYQNLRLDLKKVCATTRKSLLSPNQRIKNKEIVKQSSMESSDEST